MDANMLENDNAELFSKSEFPGAKSIWNGYVKSEFTLDGRACFIVEPKEIAPGKPWIWRARFFDAWPEADIALLGKGLHLVYMDVADMFGSPIAVAHWDRFYNYLTKSHDFSEKAVLEGFSRGGLIVYNWASKNPEKVACIYADAPVCDFKSWPGGKMNGPGEPGSWDKCLKIYGLTEKQAIEYKSNPIDNLESIAKAGVPLLHVCGDADEVVPIEENTYVLRDIYESLGGNIEIIIKEGVKHHPHSLNPPTPIVDFVLKYI